MARKSPLQLAKNKAWKQFSVYIRTRDCLKTTGNPGRGACCTCGREYDFPQLQAGHFIDGRNNAVLFSEQGVHAQCYGCNVLKHGNKVAYFLFMETTYGREIIDELVLESNQTIKRRAFDYDDLCELYKHKTADLLGVSKV